VAATGTNPITYSLTGEPAGVSINSASGLITIAATTAAGSHTFSVIASNGIIPNATQSFTLTVNASPVPIFDGLVDSYTLGAAALPVTLAVKGTGAHLLTLFKVDGVTTTQFNPTAPGTYLVEAGSTNGTVKIWKYVKVQ
jgi:hypothetical protein